jgi:hypothetical protein
MLLQGLVESSFLQVPLDPQRSSFEVSDHISLIKSFSHIIGGIGPTDQLNIVKSSTDGSTMISSDQWINLPVGNNLNDHVGTDIQISHPDVVFYDFYGAWNNPIQTDKDAYLSQLFLLLAPVL